MRVALILCSEQGRAYAQTLWSGLRSMLCEAQVFEFDNWEHVVSEYSPTVLVFVCNQTGDEVESFKYAWNSPTLLYVYLYNDRLSPPRIDKNIVIVGRSYTVDGIDLFQRILVPMRTLINP